MTVDEFGEAYFVSMITGTVMLRYKFRHAVNFVSFSPNGEWLAVAKGCTVLMFKAPTIERHFSELKLYRAFYGSAAQITSVDWTSDSKAFIVSSCDSNPRIFAVGKTSKLIVYSLTGQKQAIIGSYFFEDSLDNFSLSVDGQLCFFESDTPLDQLNHSSAGEESEEKTLFQFQKKINMTNSMSEAKKALVKSSAFHKKKKLLATGFENGLLTIHMLPEFTIISECQVFPNALNSVCINTSGELIALASEELGQLAVWEWRSNSCCLKVESHANDMTSIAYSPDGLHLVSGGSDFKVKVWRVMGGRVVVTFSEHTAAVTGVLFPTMKPRVVLSCSLDGTVRAYDLTRYRNFRTMSVSGRETQLASLACDARGDLVAAGARDTFDAFVWSVQTGQVLAVLTGHTAPISSVQFSPSIAAQGIELATGSWDGTARVWELGACLGAATAGEGDTLPVAVVKDIFHCEHDVMALAYRPDGRHMAVALINGDILFFEAETGKELGSIDGKPDLSAAAGDAEDLVSAKRLAKTRKFRSLAYSSDGAHLLAAGDSKYVCLYSVEHEILLKRFEVTCNLSLAGVQEMHDRRSFLASLGRSVAAEMEEERATLPLPGVRSGDKHSRRWWRPEVLVAAVSFAPTGDAFACASTEGILVYSCAAAGVQAVGSFLGRRSMFDASLGGGLDLQITPANARRRLALGQHAQALDYALRLRLYDLLQEVVEAIPADQVDFLARQLSLQHVAQCMLEFLGIQLSPRPKGSAHVQLYAHWAHCLLKWHAMSLRRNLAVAALSSSRLADTQGKQTEWATCQAALVKLESSLSNVKRAFCDELDSVDHLYEYLSIASKLVQRPEIKLLPMETEEILQDIVDIDEFNAKSCKNEVVNISVSDSSGEPVKKKLKRRRSNVKESVEC